MNRQPLVSCIIIFFNAGEQFFIEAIESIFAQTYDNWELLLADDGSTDTSTAIALEYAQKYPQKVRYVEHQDHQNRGMSATRNLGIRHAQGEYIAFLDADDVWFPNKLEEQVPILESHPEAAMLYGRTQYWFSWTENNPTIPALNFARTQGDYLAKTSIQFDQLIQPPTQLLLLLESHDIHPCMCSVLVRTQVIRNLGGFEEDFRNASEDKVFHSKVFLKLPIFVSSKCWDRYRKHPNSYWGNIAIQGKGEEVSRNDRLKYLTWLQKYLSAQAINNLDIQKALKKALRPYRYSLFFKLNKYLQERKWLILKLMKLIVKRILPFSIQLWLGDFIRLIILQKSVKHIFGLPEISTSDNSLIVLCVVRNGESSLKKFIEYHLSLGVKHIVFLDNDSIDMTVNIIRKYENITLLQTKYKSPRFNTVFETYLVRRFGKHKRYFFTTIDEPCSYSFTLPNNTAHLQSFITIDN